MSDEYPSGVIVPEQRKPTVTILVPTRNEVDNIEPLIKRVIPAVTSYRGEILFVDDSSDRTPEVIRTASAASAIPVKLLHRPVSERHGGLSGAVVAGMKQSDSEFIVVMDGGLQHPPEIIDDLLRTAISEGSAVVVASRYQSGGENTDLETRSVGQKFKPRDQAS